MIAILYFFTCLLQPICLPFPEISTSLWGLRMLGPIPSFLIGVLGSFMGILIMYAIQKVFTAHFLHKPKVKHYLATFENYYKRYSLFIIAALFVIPVMPDEMVIFGAVIMRTSLFPFMTLALCSKIMSIGMISFSPLIAHFLRLQSWQVIMIEIGLLFLIAFLFVKADSRRTQNERINTHCG